MHFIYELHSKDVSDYLEFMFVIIAFFYLYSLIHRYKILFLDVLFPLHVKKIIFVDADLVRIL